MSAAVIAETLRRHFVHVAYVVAGLCIAVLAAILGAVGAPGGALETMKLFIIIAACQLIGPEFSSGTLQLILSKPIRRSTYLLSRVAGVVLALWLIIAVAFGADVIARAIAVEKIDWRASGGAATGIAALAVLVCSLMALFGSFTRSYLNVALYLGGDFFFSVLGAVVQFIERAERGWFAALGAFIREHPGVMSTIRTIDRNLYPDRPLIAFDRNWLLMVFSNAAVALLLACLIFRKREVPYGAD